MNVVATIAVRDESDLIIENIEYHLQLGFSGIVVVDICSRDGTFELLEAYRDSRVYVFQAPSQDYAVFDWNKALIKEAKDRFQADVIARFDADEFLYSPLKKNLDSSELLSDRLSVKRVNCVSCLSGEFRPPKNGSEIDAMIIVKNPIITAFSQRDDSDPIPWLFTKIGPKTIGGARVIDQFTNGGHSAKDVNGDEIFGVESKEFIFIHFPMTSYERFLNKVKNIDEFIDMESRRTGESTSFHWKEWSRIYRTSGEQGINNEYERQVSAVKSVETDEFVSEAVDCFVHKSN